MFEPISAPDVLNTWLREEWEHCLSNIPYGQNLRDAWGRSGRMVRDHANGLLSKNFSPDQRAFMAPFVASLDRSDGGIPGYQGVVERCLRLVQAADKDQHGSQLENIAVATLPTNDRYAAVYTPHVARDWSVIAIDWGFICGLWGLAVCFAKIAPVAHETDGSLVISFDSERLAKGVSRQSESVRSLLTSAIVPCILMGVEPPVPLPLEDDLARVGVVGSVFNGLVFSVVAHEYAHIRLDHVSTIEPDRKRRHQMEFEADGLALAYTLKNPWRILGGSENQSLCVMAAAGQCLVLSFLGMLEMGDRMLSDLGHGRTATQTHPPAKDRLMAVQFILNKVLNLEDSVRHAINGYRQGFPVFSDEIWNSSVREILELLRRRRSTRGDSGTVAPRRADLRFL